MRSRPAFRVSGPALLAALAMLAAGCGNSRTSEPNLSQPAPPVVFRTVHFPAAGITLAVPRTWLLTEGHGRLVSTVSSGTAIVAIWRYPGGASPASARALVAARRALIRQARARDPRLKVIGSRIKRIAGAPAIEIQAIETIDGRVRRVRATHLFQRHAQLVLEEYAPSAIFGAEDQAVFGPLEASLQLSAAAAA